MWAFAHQQLRLSSSEFWSYTWREIDALAGELRAVIRRDDARIARLCFTVARCAGNDNVEVEHFMPGEANSQNLTDDQMLAQTKMIMAQLGKNAGELRPAEPRSEEDNQFLERMWARLEMTPPDNWRKENS